jgi:hypothetical protein
MEAIKVQQRYRPVPRRIGPRRACTRGLRSEILYHFRAIASASFRLRPWRRGNESMARFGLIEGGSILEIFEADTVVVYAPRTTAIFYAGLDDWRETARIHLKPGQTIETDPLQRFPVSPAHQIVDVHTWTLSKVKLIGGRE